MKGCDKKVKKCIAKLIRIVAKFTALAACFKKILDTDKVDSIYEVDTN